MDPRGKKRIKKGSQPSLEILSTRFCRHHSSVDGGKRAWSMIHDTEPLKNG